MSPASAELFIPGYIPRMDRLLIALALAWFFGLFVHPVFLLGVGACIVLIGINLARWLLTGR